MSMCVCVCVCVCAQLQFLERHTGSFTKKGPIYHVAYLSHSLWNEDCRSWTEVNRERCPSSHGYLKSYFIHILPLSFPLSFYLFLPISRRDLTLSCLSPCVLTGKSWSLLPCLLVPYWQVPDSKRFHLYKHEDTEKTKCFIQILNVSYKRT